MTHPVRAELPGNNANLEPHWLQTVVGINPEMLTWDWEGISCSTDATCIMN